jgi:sec-independent protein translocase protein TatA
MPFGIGPTELIIVLVIVMIVFGVGRLPEIGGAMGKAIREFRSSVSGSSADSGDGEAVEAKTESGKKT